MSMVTEMGIIMDDFAGDLSFEYDDDNMVDKDQDKSYYVGRGGFILKQLQDDKEKYPENYFHFLSSFLKDFKNLPEDKKIFLKETMCIEDKVKVIEKEPFVLVKKNKNKTKPKLNMGYSANRHNYDDY